MWGRAECLGFGLSLTRCNVLHGTVLLCIKVGQYCILQITLSQIGVFCLCRSKLIKNKTD